MTPTALQFSQEQQEFLSLLRQAARVAKEMRAAMSAISAEIEMEQSQPA